MRVHPSVKRKAKKSHNPCFSRNVFAMDYGSWLLVVGQSHNPCFSRNVFAIMTMLSGGFATQESQSLF